jgi:hypothetical protein
MMTGTRLIKDWDNARDIKARKQLLAIHRTRRKSSKDGVHYTGASSEGPYVRGPRAESIDETPESASWHEDAVTRLYKSLDVKGVGFISLEKLQESFETLMMPIDKETFAKYRSELLPNSNCVDFEAFVAFHKAVWANQPAAVRARAGCSGAFVGGAAVTLPGPGDVSPTNGALQRIVMAPPGLPGLKDVKDLEGQLRRVFRKHASLETGRMEFQKLPDVLKDLGLDFAKSLGEVESEARSLFNVADADHNGTLSFHEFVEFQNRYVASLETHRINDTPR